MNPTTPLNPNPNPNPTPTDDYSASATTIPFDPPLPLLRVPVRASPRDDDGGPSGSVPYVLAFRDLNSWLSAFKSSRSNVTEQCLEGARIGCAVSASRKCSPNWWSWKKPDLKEREECEVREMEVCLVEAKGKCTEFAKEKCWKPFMDSRVAKTQGLVSEDVAKKLVCWSFGVSDGAGFRRHGLVDLGLEDLARVESVVTNYRATELAVFGSADESWGS